MISTDIRSSQALEDYLAEHAISWEMAHLPPHEFFGAKFPVRLPRFYADLIDWRDEADPLRKMVIPAAEESHVLAYEVEDPIGDHSHEPIKGLIHRYPDRCLLLLTTHCLVHCRFCFRRDVIGTPLPVDIAGITPYLESHPEIHEVIFTGGDPATLPSAFLGSMIERLSKIKHIDTWRFHTRTMVVDPESVSQDWLLQLDALHDKRLVVVLHVDHAREVTAQLGTLVDALQKKNVVVLSQSVLLRGVNDSVQALSSLFSSLIQIGIKPYYLHHLDKAKGTHHFRLSIEEGKKLYTALRGAISGYMIPEYVVDLPGGDGKVPVMWLTRTGPATYTVTNFEQKTVVYIDPLGETLL